MKPVMKASAPVAPAVAIVLAMLVLAGCASSAGQRSEWPAPGTSTPYPAPASTAPGQPTPTAPPGSPVPVQPQADPSLAMIPAPKPNYPKSADEISGQAVLSLMKQAQKSRAAGQLDQASGALERAQRIEPRNYFVWSALGRVYLDKKDYDNAESVALKSNSLARGNLYVELENWKVIAAARQHQGDALGAVQAQARIDEIQRNLGVGG